MSRKGIRKKILRFAPEPRPGIVRRTFRWGKQGLKDYGAELKDGLVAYPSAVIVSGRRLHAELEAESAEEKRFGRWMMLFWFVAMATSILFFLIFNDLRGWLKLIATVPFLGLAFLWFSHDKKAAVQGMIRDFLFAPSEQGETKRDIPPSVLRELALARLRLVSSKLKEWEKLRGEERLALAPGVAAEISEVLGQEFSLPGEPADR